MRKAKVISAFPACGKSTYYREWSRYSLENVWRKNGGTGLRDDGSIIGEKIIDSDSSNFSWIKDDNGNNTKERNPDFPQNYINHIKKKMETEDVIFVSSHDVVRKALKDNDIEYHIFYPDKSMKEEWIRRFKERGNDDGFIKFISSNWNSFINDIERDDYPTKHKLDNSGINTEGINATTMMDVMDYQEK